MLFEGETLIEVFRKALGKPVHKAPTKPGGFGKQGEENPHATREAIRRARDEAIGDARQWISNADVSEDADERAIVYIYSTRTGQTRQEIDDQAGRVEEGGLGGSFRSDDKHFEFEFGWHPNYEIIVATAHSHSSANSTGGWIQRQEAAGLDALNENINRNRVDLRLRRIAPVIIKTPSGVVRVFEEPGGYE